MSSVSRTSSSLGNTALRGFGGLASGIDRDALIEQMTARTTSKITSKKQAMTKLEWKRDAYRSISNKIIDLQDNYLSYSATKSLKNSDFFAKNQVSVQGNPDYTKYISATGNADTASRVSVLGVKQLATSATLDQYKYNPALIIAGAVNDRVVAASDGQVIGVDTTAETGQTVTIGLGDSYQAIYGQLKELEVSAGDYVSQGDTIGYLAEPTKYYSVEGANLYFAMTKEGKPVNPMDYIR